MNNHSKPDPQIEVTQTTSFITNLWQAVLSGFQQLGQGIFRSLIVWFLVVGIVSLVIFMWRPVFLVNQSWFGIFEVVATVLLTGVAFEGLVKSMQYSGVFKEELKKIILDPKFIEEEKRRIIAAISAHDTTEHFVKLITNPPIITTHQEMVTKVVSANDLLERQKEMLLEIIYSEQFLKNRKDLEDFWRRMSTVVYAKTFPQISARIADRVLTDYFPKEGNFYYDNFVETLSVRMHANGLHVEVDSTTTFTVTALDPSQKIEWKFKDKMNKAPADDITTCYLDELWVGDDDRLNDSGLIVECTPDKTAVELACSLRLENSKEYEFRVKERKIYDPAIDSTIYFTTSRFINRLELNVYYPEDRLEVLFASIGHQKDDNDDRPKKPNTFRYKYDDLLFPGQGYRLTLRRRSEAS